MTHPDPTALVAALEDLIAWREQLRLASGEPAGKTLVVTEAFDRAEAALSAYRAQSPTPPQEGERPRASQAGEAGEVAHNQMLIDRLRGIPAKPSTPESDADPRNPEFRLCKRTLEAVVEVVNSFATEDRKAIVAAIRALAEGEG